MDPKARTLHYKDGTFLDLANLILNKLLVETSTCRQRAILATDESDKSLPRILICASDRGHIFFCLRPVRGAKCAILFDAERSCDLSALNRRPEKLSGPLRPHHLQGMLRAESFRSRDFKHSLAQRLISGICTKYEIKLVVFCLFCTRDNAMMYIVADEKIANN